MSATIAIITTDVQDSQQFLAVSLEERRRSSVGWKSFSSRSGRHPHAVLILATKINLGALELDVREDPKTGESVRSYMIDRITLEEVVHRLRALVDADRNATAKALVETVGGGADLERVSNALKEGDWPKSNDAAEEAAAFAKNLFGYGRFAGLTHLGICWEYRGEFVYGDREPPR